jgi:hypothetical protein
MAPAVPLVSRQAAWRLLAKELKAFSAERPVVLALPHGPGLALPHGPGKRGRGRPARLR